VLTRVGRSLGFDHGGLTTSSAMTSWWKGRLPTIGRDDPVPTTILMAILLKGVGRGKAHFRCPFVPYWCPAFWLTSVADSLQGNTLKLEFGYVLVCAGE
jgi:hypothetical protein